MNILSKPKRRSAALLTMLLCSACASVPDLGELPQVNDAASLAAGLETPRASAADLWPDSAWWVGYQDPQLTRLVEEALAGSPTLEEAAARVRRADALAKQAGASRYPSIDTAARAGGLRVSENIGLPAGTVPDSWNDAGEVSLGLTYDLDIWGRHRASLRAAMSEADAARAEEATVRLALSTGVASTYAELVRLHALKDAAATDLRIRGDSAMLIRQRLAQGLENNAALEQAEAGRANAAAELARIDEQIDLSRNQLAALLGTGPARGQQIALPKLTKLRNFGLPDDLGIAIVGRRPDVVAARLRTEAFASRIKVAKADFYPNIRLSGLSGFQALGLDDLFASGSSYGMVGPEISLPIFSGGRLEGAYRGARAEYDGAVAAYNQAIVQAVRDVADVAARQRALRIRYAQSRAALAASERAYQLIHARYRGGLAPYFEVLSAEDALNANRRAATDLEASAFMLDVALVRALGGGFRQLQS